MSEQRRHDIADRDNVGPMVRLCHKILRESLAQGATTVEFVGSGPLPAVNRHIDGAWQPYMQFPAPAFSGLLAQLRAMAGLAAQQDEATGTIHVSDQGRDVDVAVTVKRASDGTETLTLRLPARP